MPSTPNDGPQRTGRSPDALLAALMNRSSILRMLVTGRLLGPLGALIGALLFNLALALMLFMGVGREQNLGGLMLLVGVLALVAGLIGDHCRTDVRLWTGAGVFFLRHGQPRHHRDKKNDKNKSRDFKPGVAHNIRTWGQCVYP